jgi:pimeloyl-ACP methyl ester carboxylesterase
MATFALIPGAGGVSWYWHRVVPLLEQAQHEAIAVDLPGDDAQAGLSVYAERVLEAIGTREAILVAQSLGGFAAPLVCAQARVGMLIFVNGMIPLPGEAAGQWWANTGWEDARVAAAERGGYSPSFDLATYFLHDLPTEIVEQGEAHERPEADAVFGEPCRFEAWPRSRSTWSPDATIASFRSSSSVASQRNGSMSASTTFPAAISSRSATHTVLPIGSSTTFERG